MFKDMKFETMLRILSTVLTESEQAFPDNTEICKKRENKKPSNLQQ